MGKISKGSDIQFDAQFGFTREYWLTNHMDFGDWHRVYVILKEVLRLKPNSILEIGVGSGVFEDLLKSKAEHYVTFDISPILEPDVVSDLQTHQPSLDNTFDLAICSQVMEHIAYNEIRHSLDNLNSYLRNNGRLMITVPHQRLYFLWMIPTNMPHIITTRRWFLRRAKDPYHEWEIGYNTKKADLEQLFWSAGFEKLKYQKLLLADYWLLEKQ